jgi:DmsE family decaheme c-type cytochrome
MWRVSLKRGARVAVFIGTFLVAGLVAGNVLGADAPCGACHAEQASAFADTPHGRALGGEQCSGCHGDGQAHLASPSSASIRTFVSEPVSEQNAVCSSCHRDTEMAHTNAHSAAGMACSSCHSVHGEKTISTLPAGFERITERSSLCYECHEETFAQFAFNERHRLAEGAVECTSCHDPHNPRHGMSLGGFKQSQCADCHADVAGPFVFEHSASRVEGCGACHAPHGSPNRHLLKFQDVGAQCYSCHAEVAQFHLGFTPSAPPPPRFNQQTVCTNCHVTIHGSNLDPLFLR